MTRLLASLLACVFALSVQARDLPQGEFILSGVLTPLVQEGLIVPVYVHLKTGGDRLDWTFVTIFDPYPEDCETYGKCQRRLQTLSHIVDWGADDRVSVKETIRIEGEGLTIDRADVDAAIYQVIEHLIVDAHVAFGRGRRPPDQENPPGRRAQCRSDTRRSRPFGSSTDDRRRV